MTKASKKKSAAEQSTKGINNPSISGRSTKGEGSEGKTGEKRLHDTVSDPTPTTEGVSPTTVQKKGLRGVPGSKNDSRRCTAKANRTGERCKRAAIKGGTVCTTHGGAAKQVKKAAKQRLLELVEPALAALHKVLSNPDAEDSVKVRAALGILDRTGFGPGQTVTVGVSKFDELIQSVTGDVVVDRSLGGVDPRAALEQHAYAARQLSNDANAEAWREYDSEDAEAYEAGRIRPDENTVHGEVVDAPKPKRKRAPGQEPTSPVKHEGRSPLDFGDGQAAAGSTEFEQAPYNAGRGGDGPMTTEQRIRSGGIDARNDRGQRPVDIDPDDPRAQRARANAKRGRKP